MLKLFPAQYHSSGPFFKLETTRYETLAGVDGCTITITCDGWIVSSARGPYEMREELASMAFRCALGYGIE